MKNFTLIFVLLIQTLSGLIPICSHCKKKSAMMAGTMNSWRSTSWTIPMLFSVMESARSALKKSTRSTI